VKLDRSAEVLHHFGTRLHHRIPSSCLRGTGQVKPHLYGPGPVLRYRVVSRCRVLSVRPSLPGTARKRAAAGDAHCRLHVTRGPRKFWSDCN